MQSGITMIVKASDIVIVTYVAGFFKSVDPLNGTIKLDNKTFEVSDDYDFAPATKHWVEKPDTKVVCKIVGDELIDFYSQDDICNPYLTTSINPKSVYAKDGKLNVDSFELNVKLSYNINGKYDFIFDSVLNSLDLYCYSLDVNAQSDALNFGSKGFWWFKDYNSNLSKKMNYSIYAGRTYEEKYTVYLNDEYKLQSVNSVLNVNTTLKYKGGEKTSTAQISVGSLDVEEEKRAEKKSSSKLNSDINVAKRQLDQNAQSAVLYDGKLDGYISIAQQKQIKEVLYVWVSDIFATASSDYCKQNNQVKDYVYKKLGIDKRYLTDLISTHASFSFVLNTQIGKRTVKFDLELTNYSFGGSPSYAGFGKLNYKMYKNNESSCDCQGSGMVALSDMKSFTDQLIKIANDQIKSVFMNTVGNDLDKIASYLTEGTMVQVLKESGVINGSFSDNVYNMLAKPTENYLDIEVNCPVDVYVYDSNNNLAGTIINDTINPNDNYVYTFVNGTEKHIYLYDENYSIKITGNDDGKMDYTVNEMSNEGELIRKLSYNDLAVKKGKSYNAAAPSAALLNSTLYNPIGYQSDTFSPIDYLEDSVFDYSAPEKIYTSKCGDKAFFDYYSNGFCYIYGEGAMYDYDTQPGVQGINAPSESPIPNCRQILIDDGITTVGDNAFRGNTAEYIYIGDNVSSLGEYSLYNCKNLKKVYLGKSLEQIKLWAFSYSNSLEMIEIDEDNPYIKTVEGNLLSKDESKFILYVYSQSDSFEIPDGVTIIQEDAFGDSTNLLSVTLPSSVLEIKGYAFDGCNNITDVYYLDTESEWNSISIKEGNDCLLNATIHYASQPSGIIYPKRITLNYSELDVEIGKSSSLILSFSPNYTTERTVSWTSSNPNIATVSGGTILGKEYGTTTITAKTSNGLTATCIVTVVPVCDDDFRYTLSRNPGEDFTASIYEYNGTATNLRIPDKLEGCKVVSIWGGFENCTSLVSIEIPEGVEYIGDETFKGCTNLKSIKIPESVKKIDWGAFYNCESLTSITIPAGVTEIYGWTFCNCQSLQSIKINGALTDIDSHAFCDCTSLKEFDIPSTVTEIGEQAFWGCSGLRSVTIPVGVTEINYATFKNCTELKDVYYDGSESQWNAITIGEDNECLLNANIHFKTSEKIDPTGVALSKSDIFLVIGKNYTLSANVLPSNATNKTVTWTSSDSEVARVINGKVTAYKTGITSITATTSNGKTASCRVIVIPDTDTAGLVGDSDADGNVTIMDATCVQYFLSYLSVSDSFRWLASDTDRDGDLSITDATYIQRYAAGMINSFSHPESISLNATSKKLGVGETLTLNVSFTPSQVMYREIVWISNNNSVATVNNGKVTAKSVGTATITATTYNGKEAKCSITVAPTPNSVTLNSSSISLNVGGTYQLSATVSPSDANDKTVSWSTSNSAVATVDSTGKITAKSSGSATITATTSNGKKASCTVNVNSIEVSSVSLNAYSITLDEQQTYQLSATVYPSNATNQTLTWSTNNSSVATVSSTGKVTAVSGGIANITVKTTNGKSASCAVTVNEKIMPKSIEVLPEVLTLTVGNTFELNAKITPNNAENKSVSWSSSNSNAVSVDQNGKLVANKAGMSATITARTVNGLTSTVTVDTVKDSKEYYEILNKASQTADKQYWVVFNEGYRNDRIEMSSFTAKQGFKVSWDKGVYCNNQIGECTQYVYNEETKEFVKIGTYSNLTDYATNIIGSNTSIYDSSGNRIVSPYNSQAQSIGALGVKYDETVYSAPVSQGPYYVSSSGDDLYYILNIDCELYQGATLKMYITSGSSGSYSSYSTVLSSNTYDYKTNKGYISISQYLNNHVGQYIRVYTEVVLANKQVIKPANLGTDDAIYLYMN